MSGEQIKPGFKRTEVGVIPEDWRVAAVKDIAVVGRGRVISHREIAKALSPAYPVYSSQTSNEGVMGYLDSFDFDGEYITWTTDGANAGTVFYRNGKFNCTNVCGTIKVINDDTYFISKALSVVAPKYVSRNLGNPKLMNDVAKQIDIALPTTTTEQRAIAAALSDVDALLAKLDQLIAKKRDLKQATMQQLLTGQTRLPGFSGDWEVKRLGDIAVLNRHNLVPASQPDHHFVHFSLPAFDDGMCAPVELGSAIGSNKFQVPPDAVLVSKLNPRIPRIWAPETIPSNSCASTEWLVLTPEEGCSRSFLFVLCSSPYFCEQMELQATGTTGSHQRISPSTALRLEVSVPVDKEEQTAIATAIAIMDAELAALETRRDKTRALKQGMMQELLTGRIRLFESI